jgi:STE24 endopeptidase
MHPLTLTFAVLLVLGVAVRLWLSLRQQRAVLAERERVPEAFAGAIPPEDHRKAADYAAARQRLYRADIVVDACWLAALTLGGGLGLVDLAMRAAGLDGIALGVAVIVSTALLGALVSLPLSVYGTFGVEARFGFNRTTPRLYVIDLLKGLALGLLIGVPLVALLLWLFDRAGPSWWLWAWAAWAAFSLALTWAWPRIIAPLFNKFRPLEPGELRSRIEGLVHRCGFESRGVFVMDGSRRSTHGNAYFAGLGNAKRIVFFDTLLERLAPDEVEAVLAHELGHFRLHHVALRLAVSLAVALGGFALLGWLAGQPWFYSALGVSDPSPHAALMLFILVVPVFTLPLTPLGAWWSRRHEYAADGYARQHASGERLAAALVKLYRDNATSLTSDPLYSAFHDSHPPAPRRIAALRSA